MAAAASILSALVAVGGIVINVMQSGWSFMPNGRVTVPDTREPVAPSGVFCRGGKSHVA